MGGRSSSVRPQWETWTVLPPLGTGQWEPPRATHQEAFKFLGFCDVDPAVFLHHLDVLHLVVEPGPSTRAQWARCRPTRPRPRRAPGLSHMYWSQGPDPRSTPPAPAPAWGCLQLSVQPSSRPPGLSEAQTPRSARPRAPEPHTCLPRSPVETSIPDAACCLHWGRPPPRVPLPACTYLMLMAKRSASAGRSLIR